MIRFRDAAEADIPALIGLLTDDALGSGRETPGEPERYRTAFARLTAQGGRILLAVEGGAEADGLVVGCLQLDLIQILAVAGQVRATVEGVRVAASRRGQGIGSALMREAIRQATAAGAGLMQLTTNLSRTEARRFYESLGFTYSHAGMKLPLDAG